LREPAVASERCARRPESEMPEFRIRMRRTRRFERKSEVLKETTVQTGNLEVASFLLVNITIYVKRTKDEWMRNCCKKSGVNGDHLVIQ